MCEQQRAKIATLIVEAIRRNKAKAIKQEAAQKNDTQTDKLSEADDES